MGDMAVLTQAIDPASDRAVHKQIADQLRAANRCRNSDLRVMVPAVGWRRHIHPNRWPGLHDHLPAREEGASAEFEAG